MKSSGPGHCGRKRSFSRMLRQNAKEIGSLPEVVELQELIVKHEENQASLNHLEAPVAISMDDLTPFYVSLKDGPYFVVGSPVEGGKTSFLQTWMLSLSFFYSPDENERNFI